MKNSPKLPEDEREVERHHHNVKWLLTLISAIVTTGLVIILNGQL